MACVAGGAFSSTSTQYDEIQKYNQNEKTSTQSTDIYTKQNLILKGTKVARLFALSGLVGSSVAASANDSTTGTNSSNSSSSTDACYSNCYSEPAADTTPQQCMDAGFSKTTCDSGYTLSGECSYNSAYFNSCTCHTDCTEMYQDALEDIGDSSDMFAHDLSWDGTVVEATGITGSGSVSISTVPWYTSTAAAQLIINATGNKLSNYNTKCGGNLTWSCYSNCHTEASTCEDYLKSINVTPVSTYDELLTAARLTGGEIAVMADLTATPIGSYLDSGIPLDKITGIYGAKHYSYSDCQSKPIPKIGNTSYPSMYMLVIYDAKEHSFGDINIDKIRIQDFVEPTINMYGNVSIYKANNESYITFPTYVAKANSSITINSFDQGGIKTEANSTMTIKQLDRTSQNIPNIDMASGSSLNITGDIAADLSSTSSQTSAINIASGAELEVTGRLKNSKITSNGRISVTEDIFVAGSVTFNAGSDTYTSYINGEISVSGNLYLQDISANNNKLLRLKDASMTIKGGGVVQVSAISGSVAELPDDCYLTLETGAQLNFTSHTELELYSALFSAPSLLTLNTGSVIKNATITSSSNSMSARFYAQAKAIINNGTALMFPTSDKYSTSDYEDSLVAPF